MPKNADESRSKMKFKSTRKPLRDVSNAKAAIKSASIHNKISEGDRGKVGDDSLDRLLLVHSDLSSRLRQVVHLLRSGNNLNRHDLGVIFVFGCLVLGLFFWRDLGF